MKRRRFSEEQIVTILKEHELGAKAVDLARKHGISEATLYNWKAKYGGLTVSEAKRLKSLEDENTKLKKLLADSMLDNAALKELLSKNW
jgi:putative transposase